MGRRLRLKGSWRALRAEDASVWLFSELSNRRLRLDDPHGLAAALLSAADGTRGDDEVVAAAAGATGLAPADAREGLDGLVAARVLEDASLSFPDGMPPGYVAAFRRNAAYFAEFEGPGVTRMDLASRLHRARVGLLGLGGTSSWVAAGLVSAGVGHLRGIDFDTVEPENLGRQIFYRAEDVGKTKPRAMADEIGRFNPSISFEGREGVVGSAADVRAFVEGLDFLVVGCGSPRFLLTRWVNEACLDAGVPYLVVQTRQVGPLVVPRQTACHACYEEELRAHHPVYDRFVEASLRRSGARASGERISLTPEEDRLPQFGPLVAYAGVRASLEVVRHLTGAGRVESRGAVLTLAEVGDDGWTRHEIGRRADCPACAVEVRAHA